MSKYRATIQMVITVEFEDDGENDLRDQAIDAATMADISPFDADMSIVGEVEEVLP